MYAAISADVVSSTSLSRESMIELNEKLRKCLYILEERYQGFWGRIVRGDSIECVMDRPEDAFEVALILKTWIKSFEPSNIQKDKRFNRYGLRIAIGIGEMKTIDRGLDMMDGRSQILPLSLLRPRPAVQRPADHHGPLEERPLLPGALQVLSPTYYFTEGLINPESNAPHHSAVRCTSDTVTIFPPFSLLLCSLILSLKAKRQSRARTFALRS